MLQRVKYVVIIFVLLTITTTELFAQSIYGPSNPNTYREIYRVGTQALQTGLIQSNSYCLIGKNMVSGQQAVGRVVFQWNIPDNIIPDNTTVRMFEREVAVSYLNIIC